MDGQINVTEKKEVEEEFSLKKLFVPLTTTKAVHWIITIGIFVFFNSLFNGFVGDDEGQITGAALVHSLSNIPIIFHSVLQMGTNQGGTYYKPVTYTIITILYSFFGNSAFFYHLTQVTLHIANSILVYFLLKKYIRNTVAFFLSLTFLVHPINSETVSYLADLQDVLFMFFGLLALHLIAVKKQMLVKASLVILMLLASVLSKETGILFFIVIPLYSWLFLSKERLTIFISTGISFLVYLLLRFSSTLLTSSGLYPSAISQLNFPQRLLSIPKIVFFYLHLFIFPNSLAIGWNWVVERATFADFYLPLLFDCLFLLLLVFFILFLHRKKNASMKIYTFFAVWFILGLTMHLQIIPLDFTVADRWFYFPLVGLLGMIGIAINQIRFSDKKLKVIAISAACLLIFILGIRTIIRNANFHDDITLYSHDLKIIPDNSVLENGLGVAYFHGGNISAAKQHYERSIKLDVHSESWNNLGVIYVQERELKKAKVCFQQSVAQSGFELGYENLAQYNLLYDTPQSAKTIALQGLAKYPDKPVLWFILAQAEYKLGNKSVALTDAQKSFELSPSENIYQFINEVNREIK